MPSSVLIAIQARSNNSRFPGKCLKKIGGIAMLDRVIYAAKKSAQFLNNGKGEIKVDVCLLVPDGDPLGHDYERKLRVFYGSEDDVLSRFGIGFDYYDPDYIVRLTSDCPMLPPFVISKHITIADKHNYDYVSNVDERVRTSVDGFDVEVISNRLFKWCLLESKSEYDKEHVTTLIRSSKPDWARMAHVINYADYSQLKLSVDTEDDLAFVSGMNDMLEEKLYLAKETAHGVFRI